MSEHNNPNPTERKTACLATPKSRRSKKVPTAKLTIATSVLMANKQRVAKKKPTDEEGV